MRCLYPWVNKTHEYPVGHPSIIVNPEDQDIHHYFGMAKVDVLPPYDLYIPSYRTDIAVNSPSPSARVAPQQPSDYWSPEEQDLDISTKEALAIEKMLLAYREQLKKARVDVLVDNQAVV